MAGHHCKIFALFFFCVSMASAVNTARVDNSVLRLASSLAAENSVCVRKHITFLHLHLSDTPCECQWTM